MNTPPRLKDVAEAAGVSAMTVSLALRNHTSLPTRTRDRIRKIAAAMGYRPDPNISKLMAQVRGKKDNVSGKVLAYLTAHDTCFGWKVFPTQRDYHDGAAKHADELGYRLEHFWLGEPGMTEQRLSRIIRNRGIEGVIVAPLPSPGTRFKQFEWDHFSAVGIGYSLRDLAIHRCCNQQFQSMMTLLGCLRGAGYRRIGLAMGPGQDERTNHNWRAAYLTEQSLNDPHSALPMLHGDDAGWSRDILSAWIDEHGPDAIVTVGTDVQSWLKQLGLKTPGRIGLANVDLSESMLGITGIYQNAHHIGAAAVDLLLSLLGIGERGLPKIPRTLMVDGRFIQRASTRALRRSGKKRPGRLQDMTAALS